MSEKKKKGKRTTALSDLDETRKLIAKKFTQSFGDSGGDKHTKDLVDNIENSAVVCNDSTPDHTANANAEIPMEEAAASVVSAHHSEIMHKGESKSESESKSQSQGQSQSQSRSGSESVTTSPTTRKSIRNRSSPPPAPKKRRLPRSQSSPRRKSRFDPNELCDRLRLLISAQERDITTAHHEAEIESILEKLQFHNIIL